MTERWAFFVCFILFLQAASCHPVNQIRVPRNEIQYSNNTVVGTYSYTDGGGNPINVKYYADKSGYGVELHSFKTFKIIDSSTSKEALHNPKPAKNYVEPVKPLLDLAAEIIDFDHKLNKAASSADTTIRHPDTFNPFDDISKITKIHDSDYEKYYQNEVKAPKQCEKDKVRVYLAKEERKKKNALQDVTTKTTTRCG